MAAENLNNDMIPVGTAVHITPEDIKWEVKGDLISREALKEAFANSKHIKEMTDGLDVMEMLAIIEIIDNAPTVEAYTLLQVKELVEFNQKLIDELEERPQGKWIFRSGGYYKCNKCGEVERAEKNYCSNCGAKMGGK